MTIQEQYHTPAVDPALVPGTLRGFRAWRMPLGKLQAIGARSITVKGPTTADGWLLFADVEPVEWNPGERNVAECTRVEMSARLSKDNIPYCAIKPQPCAGGTPNPECSCGFYARYRMDFGGNHDGVQSSAGLLWGSIQASGRIIMATGGFRAQYARVESIVMPPSTSAVQLLHRFNLAAAGVRVFETNEEMLAECPPQDVSHLITVPTQSRLSAAEILAKARADSRQRMAAEMARVAASTAAMVAELQPLQSSLARLGEDLQEATQKPLWRRLLERWGWSA